MTDPMTREQETMLLDEIINPKGLGWLHYLPGSWLLADASDQHTVDSLQEHLSGLFPQLRVMLLEVAPYRWGVRMHTDQLEAQKTWLSQHWEPSGPGFRGPN